VSFENPGTGAKGGPESFRLYIKHGVLFIASGLLAGFGG
jgi:hypothetical protein